MDNTELLECYNSGQKDFSGLCLAGLQLSKSDLIGANFSKADLERTDLMFCYLSRVNL